EFGFWLCHVFFGRSSHVEILGKQLMNDSFLEYFKCPERYARFGMSGPLSANGRYFHFGTEDVCYGRLSQPQNGSDAGLMRDALQEAKIDGGIVSLPFDFTEVVDNLRLELYPSSTRNERSILNSLITTAYYCVRPLLPVSIRKHLQRARLKGWDSIPFPHWPVDRTVDDLFEFLMVLSLKSQKAERI